MTMKTPEMEVVRFTESDVMCASGPVVEHKYARTNGWGNSLKGDATIRYYNGHDNTYGIDELESMLGNGMLNRGSKFTNNAGNSVTLGEMVSGGDAEGLYAEFNGEYETWDSGENWTWRQ